VERPLWREDGSAICSAITQWSESLRTRNHTLLSHLRLPPPGEPGSHIYIPQEQGGPVIPPATGFSCDYPMWSPFIGSQNIAGNLVVRNRHCGIWRCLPMERRDFVREAGDNSAWTLLNSPLTLPHPICFPPPPVLPQNAIYILSLVGLMTQKMKMAAKESRNFLAERQPYTC
jgi:hypothetical protein